MHHLKTVAKAVISIGLFSFLVYTSDPQQILNILGNIYSNNGLIYFLLAVATSILSVFLMSLRWKIILDHYNIKLRVSRLFGFYLVGLFFNNFLPTSIGGDIVRIYKVIGDSDERTASFSSVIIERLVGIAATLFLSITSLYYVSHYFKDDRILYTSIILFSLIVVFFFLITRNRPFEFLLKIFDKVTVLNIGEKINKLMEAIHLLREKRRIFVWMFLLSVLAQIAIVFMNYAAVLALDIEVDLLYLFLVVPVTFMITMLPSINGVGLRDGGFVFLLGKIGVSGAAAISLSFMNVLIPMIISLWGALLFLIQRKKSNLNKVENIEKDI
ncbi:MAG: flippase-like domain-containing protein [Calditrichae bacterium]|nr:flippase-like domain-containing protein [Calditrichota bacterium]MCB9058892.1 flippase-like domain-containing protein [Calditrichia bacterium]